MVGWSHGKIREVAERRMGEEGWWWLGVELGKDFPGIILQVKIFKIGEGEIGLNV